jgi:hypothetical protein
MKMKAFWILAVAIIFTSCKKANLDPIVGEKPLESVTTLPTKPKSFDINFELPAQIAVTKVDQHKLTIIYTEKVRLLVDTTEYITSWGLHLTENFSSSALANYDFTTVSQHGIKTFNWVDDNLNNVIIKAKKDTTVNGKTYKKVTVERDFTFAKEYPDVLAATEAQKALLLRKDDIINFTSFYYSTNKEMVPASALTKVQYIAAVSPSSGS